MSRSLGPIRNAVRVVSVHCLLMLFAAGCERQTAPSRYSVVIGDIAAAKTDIGEMTVRVSRRGGQDAPGETLHCTVTGDSEIYVNDRFSSIAEIAAGDRVELIGYRDPNPAIDRFIVTYAAIEHPMETSIETPHADEIPQE